MGHLLSRRQLSKIEDTNNTNAIMKNAKAIFTDKPIRAYKEVKPFINYEYQIIHIKKKGITISDDSKVKNFLKHHSYYKIQGYIYGMYKERDWKKENVKTQRNFDKDFVCVQKVYNFDEDLRRFIMQYIEKLEVSLSSIISYKIAEKYTSFPYEGKCFSKKTLDSILKDKEKHRQNPIVTNYYDTHK